MLSYQHIYHAGNFADVQKHAILARLLELLAQKPQSFTFLDTHAGRGLYDLDSDEAQKIGEFKTGILPFWAARGEPSPLSRYLNIVAAANAGDALKAYPGSAKIAHSLMRSSDKLLLIEKHPGENAELQKSFAGATNVKIEQADGFARLVSQVPFAQRQGLVLIDPSYEIKSEYADLPKQLQRAYKKWPQGQFMVWYPLLPAGLHRQMLADLHKTNIKNTLVSEIYTDAQTGMYGSGILIINPPFGFETALSEITQFIATRLPGKAEGHVFWLDNLRTNADTGLLELPQIKLA